MEGWKQNLAGFSKKSMANRFPFVGAPAWQRTSLPVARIFLPFLVAVALATPARLHAEDRSVDGSGNNLANPTWGQAGTQLLRIAPAAYGDGVSTPAGADRPDARVISNTVVAQSASMPNSYGLSDWVFQWGQFVDHDTTLTDITDPAESMDVPMPMGDPTFDPGSTGTVMMPFTRSNYDPLTGTGLGNPRQQINSDTSYLDGSVVYGSDATRAAALRTFSGGHLQTSAGNMLPYNTAGLPNADNGDPNHAAYHLAGDIRVNEQTGLTAVQTLFMREHNRLADQLAAANPAWTDEQIYQHARHLVGGEIQAITYQEFLPALLGNLAPGINSVYNPNVNASIANEFATALYRVGHTMLPSDLARVQNDGTTAPGGDLALRDAFFTPSNLPDGTELEYVLKGLASQAQQQIDIHMVDDVRNFLFGDPFPGAGFDLATLNIERGRDHGLPDYNTMREAYGLPPVSSFADITSDVVLQQELASLYGDVNHIDAWVGALSEDPLAGAAVGPLVALGLIDQFTRLRDGDRFWFTRDAALSADELSWLESISLADIIRLDTGVTNLQDNVFLMVPEPGTHLLAIAGLAGLGLVVKRRRAV